MATLGSRRGFADKLSLPLMVLSFVILGGFLYWLNITAEPTEVVTALPMEFGEVEVDDQWKTVVMKRPFDDPVVVVAAPSYNDQDPVVIRVRNVTGDSFEVRVQEWNYLDGEHALEKTGYIVVESGSYELPGGTRVEAGRFTASAVSGFETVQFKQPFSTVPVMIATTTTSNESDAVASRMGRVTTEGGKPRCSM